METRPFDIHLSRDLCYKSFYFLVIDLDLNFALDMNVKLSAVMIVLIRAVIKF